MQNTWHNKLSEWFFGQKHADLDWHLSLVVDGALLLTSFLVALIAYFVVRKIVFGIVTRVVKKTTTTWMMNCLTAASSSGFLCSSRQ